MAGSVESRGPQRGRLAAGARLKRRGNGRTQATHHSSASSITVAAQWSSMAAIVGRSRRDGGRASFQACCSASCRPCCCYRFRVWWMNTSLLLRAPEGRKVDLRHPIRTIKKVLNKPGLQFSLTCCGRWLESPHFWRHGRAEGRPAQVASRQPPVSPLSL